MFLLVPAYPGCPGSKAVKRSLLLLLFYGSCCDLADTLVILHYYTADYKKSIQVPMDTYIHTYKFIWRQNCENESEALAQDD